MAELSNERWEKFCQFVASGFSQRQAYIKAGFNDSRSNAAQLAKRDYIKARIKELKEQNFKVRNRIQEEIENNIIKQETLTRSWVLDRLIENAIHCMTNNQRAAANRSLELLGKELGMFIDRSEVHTTGELAKLTDEELLNRLKEEMLLQNTVIVDHEPMEQGPESLLEDSSPEDSEPTIN